MSETPEETPQETPQETPPPLWDFTEGVEAPLDYGLDIVGK